MSHIDNPHMIPAGLKECNEDGQEMEACSTNSQEASLVESYHSDAQGKMPKASLLASSMVSTMKKL